MSKDNKMMTFGGHLEMLRQMLFRILAVIVAVAVIVFSFKDYTFGILLSPSKSEFCLYRWIELFVSAIGFDFHFAPFDVKLITTDLSSQFMIHIKTSLYLGLLGASPYAMFELFKFISPALYDNERRYFIPVLFVVYILFMVGVMMSYYILFPISFRFLGTYSVAEQVLSTITLDSYITTFATLTFVLGIIFQMPVVVFFLAKIGVIDGSMLADYRKYAFFVIMIAAAIITPPDLMTLVLVTIPLYLLYEVSIIVAKRVHKSK